VKVAVAALTLGLMATAAGAAMPERRLTPDEIAGLPKLGAGAGTSGVAGIQTTILSGDPTKAGPYTIALSVPAHTRIAAHTHRDDRASVVVSGEWFFGYGAVADDAKVKALAPGGFYTEPAGEPHFAQTRDKPAVVYISGVGPTDTVYSTPPAKP
jgi:quercetin dioxygenase-like cupin family protein